MDLSYNQNNCNYNPFSQEQTKQTRKQRKK